MKTDFDDNFDDYWTPEPFSGCHLWFGAISGVGYGQFWDGKSTWGAHRFALARHNGGIPKGLIVLHKCDTPLCVNPAHLFLGTNSDNTRDALRKGRLNYVNNRFSSGLRKSKTISVVQRIEEEKTDSGGKDA